MNLRSFEFVASQPKVSQRQRDLRDQMLSMGSALGEPGKWLGRGRTSK